MSHIQLDLVGGIAGDMFIAAMLDAFPEHRQSVLEAITAVRGSVEVDCTLTPFNDGVLQGQHFKVRQKPRRVVETTVTGMARVLQQHQPARPANHRHDVHGGPSHVHNGGSSWRNLRQLLSEARIDDKTRAHALAIFELLAGAEATVHGVDVDDVTFHEVGAWDSIADVIGAASLIQLVNVSSWSCSAAPLGGGRVVTAHGELPVPAPATALLLLGMAVVDDGIPGERVTPTGAAILRYLCPPAEQIKRRPPDVRVLRRTGAGFGSRKLLGISNHLRVLCFEKSSHEHGGQREMHVLEFELDDQSAEDLAMGLDRLRAHEGVLDVTQSPVFGKKGRIMTHVRVLARYADVTRVIEACFRETTTIGLRQRLVNAIGLERSIETVDVEGHSLRVKVVQRPGGATAKTEADDVLLHTDHARRAAIRGLAETRALDLHRGKQDA